MRCHGCGCELPVQQGFCPNCGAILLTSERVSLGKRNPALVIFVSLAAFFAIAATAGLIAYRAVKARAASRVPNQSQPGSREEVSSDEPAGFPVEHGKVVRPEELHAHGKLYFVPVGKQAIPVQSLADYYLEKFGAPITVLPPVEVRPGDCVPQRRQCVAEELEAEMTSAYPEIARNPDSVMIALTDEDIFPRALGWRFTYSLHSARIGIVSSHRMDPAFWGEPPDEAVRLASTKQMLTKYVAMQYFHLPASFDPTSVMYTPLTPDGGSDDIYESDVRSEESVNGRRGKPFPCLYFTYSYKTHKIKADEPSPSDCEYHNPAHAEEENFETNLGWGALSQRTMDLELSSLPPIDFRRGYNSGYSPPMDFGLGWGANHSYNAWISSDGITQLTSLQINSEDGVALFFGRNDQGRGFNPNAIYETEEDSAYGARLKWESHVYKLRYRDGAVSTYLECPRPVTRCYWIGYQDAKGNAVRFDRAGNQELNRLTSSDNQGMDLKYDDQHRIVSIKATNGKRVSYEYDAAGCLARVRRADGQVALYQYDSAHRMTSFSVARRAGAAPKIVLSNQYDAQGRVVRQTVAGLGVYKIEYLATAATEKYASELRITNPAGQSLKISVQDEENVYVVHAASIRFPRAADPSSP